MGTNADFILRQPAIRHDDVSWRMVCDVLSLIFCVSAQCPYGTRYLNGICMYCDKGTYQNLTGQTECTACPYGYTTNFKGSTSILDCGGT